MPVDSLRPPDGTLAFAYNPPHRAHTPMIYLILLMVLGVIAGLAYVVSSAVTAWSIRLANRRNLLAAVNERSSHAAPVPRLGGIGLMGGVALGLAVVGAAVAMDRAMPAWTWLAITGGHVYTPTWVHYAGIVAALVGAFALGLWDDLRDAPALAKLGIQACVALLPPLCGFRIDLLLLPGVVEAIILPPAVGIVLTAAWLLLAMNVVNFMDGIDGLAGRAAQVAACGMLVGSVTFMGSGPLVALCAALWGASEGFLRHNLPHPARTFLGDGGSQPLGLLLGLLAVLVARQPTSDPLPFVAPMIVLSPLVFDVVYTLARRALAGEPLMRAHRGHLYQRFLIASGGAHGPTLSLVESHLWVAALCGAAYAYFGWNPANVAVQGVCLAVAAGNLIWYARTVLAAERAAPKDR